MYWELLNALNALTLLCQLSGKAAALTFTGCYSLESLWRLKHTFQPKKHLSPVHSSLKGRWLWSQLHFVRRATPACNKLNSSEYLLTDWLAYALPVSTVAEYTWASVWLVCCGEKRIRLHCICPALSPLLGQFLNCPLQLSSVYVHPCLSQLQQPCQLCSILL